MLKGVIFWYEKTAVWFPGAKYPITSRGLRKFPLFYDDFDRYKYIWIYSKEAIELLPLSSSSLLPHDESHSPSN